jgi:hypothetical protein
MDRLVASPEIVLDFMSQIDTMSQAS